MNDRPQQAITDPVIEAQLIAAMTAVFAAVDIFEGDEPCNCVFKVGVKSESRGCIWPYSAALMESSPD